MRSLILLFILFGYFNTKVSSQVIHPDSNLTYSHIGKQLTYFEDKQADLSLDSVKILEKSGKFKRGKSDILNLGNTKSAFWIRIHYLSNGSNRNYLVIDMPNIEHIDCYIPTNKGMIHRSAGSIQVSSPGVITTNNYVFDLPPQSAQPAATTLWLRVKTDNILLLPIKMATSENFIPGASVKNNLETIYIGILLALFIFNIFLYFSVKDITYLYYSLYVLFLGIYVATYLRGYAYLFGHGFRILLNLYPHVFLSISIIAAVLFSKKFLNLRTISPKLIKICDFAILCSIIMFFTSIAGFKSIATTISQYITMGTSVMLCVFALTAYRKGHKPAIYFILAWNFIGLTVIAMVLSMEGVITCHDYTFEFVPIGSTIELLLLAFALGDRYRTIIKNEQKVRDENFCLIQTQNQRLEKQVKDRTLKLSEAIVKLEDSNGVKNKLFSIIAHDLRSPFNSLISIFALKDMDLLSLDELKMLLSENRKNIDTIHNTLNNLLYWAQSQMEGIKTQPFAFNLKLLIEDLILVYSPLIQLKGIAVSLQTDERAIVYADENQIQLVLRNLIDNAIKFTPPAQSIGISLTHTENGIEISVSNTISNTNEFNIESITNPNAFETTYGTGQEKGIGLGLHLCREYIRANGGELEVRMAGRLVSFCFKLPGVKIENTISI